MSKQRIYILFIFFAIGYVVRAQNVVELRKAITVCENDTQRVRLLGELCEICENREIDSIATIIITECDKHLNNEKLDKKSRSVYIIELARAYNNMGYLAQADSKVIYALEQYQKGLLIVNVIKTQEAEELRTSIYNNLASVHIRIRNYNKAIKLLKLVVEVDKKNNQINYLATDYNNIGSAYDRLEVLDSALKYFRLGLNMRRENINNRGTVTSNVNVANIYLKTKSLDSALYYLKVAKDLADKNSIKESYSNINYFYGQVYYQKAEYGKALLYYQEALKYAKYTEELIIRCDAHRGAYDVYKQLKDYDKALMHHELYRVYEDSVVSEKMREEGNIRELKFNYNRDKIVQKQLFEKKIFIENQKSEKRQRIINYGIYTLIMITIFMIFIIWRWRITARQKRIIEKQKLQLWSKQEKIMSYSYLIEQKNKKINDTIEYAFNMQSNLLPSIDEINQKYKCAILYLPCDIVSGDFYYCKCHKHYSIFILGDCTGHGVSGAFISVLVIKSLDKVLSSVDLLSADEIIKGLNYELHSSFKRGDNSLFGVDIAVVIMNEQTKEVHFSGSASKLTYVDVNEEVKTLKFNNLQIGNHCELAAKPVTVSLMQTELKKICLYTDGYVDQKGGVNNKRFGTKKLDNLLIKTKNVRAKEQIELLSNELEAWKRNTAQIDDISFWVFDI